MTVEIGSPQHRYISLGIFLVVCYLFFLIIDAILTEVDQAESRYSNALFQLEKYQTLVKNEDQVIAQRQQLRQFFADKAIFLNHVSVALARADLQKHIQKIMNQAGATLISMQAVEKPAASGLLPVSMRVNARMNHESLSQFLQQLEQKQPLGFIDDLQVQRTDLNRGFLGGGQTELELSLVYTAYRISSNGR